MRTSENTTTKRPVNRPSLDAPGFVRGHHWLLRGVSSEEEAYGIYNPYPVGRVRGPDRIRLCSPRPCLKRKYPTTAIA